MRHPIVEDWSRRSSPLHRLDPRAKLAALLLVLIAISASPAGAAAAALLIALAVLRARLPAAAFLLRTAAILPFAGTVALVTALSGDSARAALLLARGWLSAAAILVLAGTTPLPDLLAALRRIGVPAMLVEVIQFVYRYLFLLAEQVWRMKTAVAARGGRGSFRAAIRTAAVLFARSHERAERIHRSMLARGYTGELHTRSVSPLSIADYVMTGMVAAYFAAVFLLFHGTAHFGS